ncbi:hypothetical protein KGP36_06395 [Patescibacteria group bacterium]|nr:hypothetical protein [Patescibacteria group bacterium]
MDEQWKVNVAISNANQKIREAGDLLLEAASILEESGETARAMNIRQFLIDAESPDDAEKAVQTAIRDKFPNLVSQLI